MNTTRSLPVIAAAFAVLPVSSAFASSYTYKLTEIMPLYQNHTSSEARQLLDDGTVLLSSCGGSSCTEYLWNRGHVTGLEVNSGEQVFDSRINANGDIVTNQPTENGGLQAGTYNAGSFTPLPNLSGTAHRTGVSDLNDNGLVIGGDDTGAALLWTDGSVERLAEFTDVQTQVYDARAINNSSQIVGGAHIVDPSTSFVRTSAVLWDNGQITNLGDDPVITGVSFAQDINDLSQAVGYAQTADGIHATLWQDGAATIIGDPVLSPGSGFGPASSAQAINDLGQVVGYGGDSNGTFGFIWDIENGFQNLADLIDPALGWVFHTAVDINNNGQITGWGRNANGESRAFLLTPEQAIAPVPLPAGLPLMIGGMISLVALRRRQKKTAA